MDGREGTRWDESLITIADMREHFQELDRRAGSG